LYLAQESLPSIIKKVEPSTVVVLTYDEDGTALGIGSGFFIDSNGDIITNYHVVEGASQARIKTADGNIHPVVAVVAEDRDGDLVRLSVDIPRNAVRSLSVSPSLPEVGERVIVVGNPLGLEHTVSDGIVSAIREIPSYGKIIQITAPISKGSSGSPVVNMKGEVIGVATFHMAWGENLNFAIPGERVARLRSGIGRPPLKGEATRRGYGPTSAEELYTAGLDCLGRKDYGKALSYFEKAAEKNPRSAEAHFGIGYCKLMLGRPEEAIRSYKDAIRVKPDYAEAHYNLGIAYFSIGEKGSAFQEYRILRDLNQVLAIKLFNHISSKAGKD